MIGILTWVMIWGLVIVLNGVGRKTLGITDNGVRWFLGVSCFQAATALVLAGVWFHATTWLT